MSSSTYLDAHKQAPPIAFLTAINGAYYSLSIVTLCKIF